MDAERAVKLLFTMRHAGYVRNFESTLRTLCDRGHHVHVCFERRTKYEQLDPADIARRLATDYPQHFASTEIRLPPHGWSQLGREFRLGVDYLRYLGHEYDDAPKLRERATREAPSYLLRRSGRGVLNTAPGRRAVQAWLRALNRAVPRNPKIDDLLSRVRPDVLAVTPLLEPGSPQAEYLASARALGIRTAYCVASWDNLTNKGLIHGPVDLVAVWNDAMKQEVVELHGVAPDRVVVTGAAAFDQWFDWQVSTPRDVFCARIGLAPDRPYILYLCSSKFVAPEEVSYVRAWVEQIRRCAVASVRNVGILVRPHPQNADQWQKATLDDLGACIVWPRGGAAPVDRSTRAEYFDSIYHSVAVVGVNTTAEIESAIVGRPVYTLLASKFRDTQEGTLHFRHLQHVNGGLLHVARDMSEHLQQLEDAIASGGRDDGRGRRFIEAFVRPYGLDAPATPRLVDALERLAATPQPSPERPPAWAPLVHWRFASRAAGLQRDAEAVLHAAAARRAAKAAREERRRQRAAGHRARIEAKPDDPTSSPATVGRLLPERSP
jgi:hypothetical protein